jgi:hypothetical protein
LPCDPDAFGGNLESGQAADAERFDATDALNATWRWGVQLAV